MNRMRESSVHQGLVTSAVSVASICVVCTQVLSGFPTQANFTRTQDATRLSASFSSTVPTEFRRALGELAKLDEPGLFDLWSAALHNPDSVLRNEAWRRYRAIRP